MSGRASISIKSSAGQLLLLVFTLLSAACGFRLAGTADLPAELESIYLVTSNFSEAQSRVLRRELTNAGARLVEQGDATAIRLNASLSALPDRQLVSSASSGSTINRLVRDLNFSVKAADGSWLLEPQTLRQQVDIDLDDDNLLASNRERDSAIQQLEKSLYQQLIRQLTGI